MRTAIFFLLLFTLGCSSSRPTEESQFSDTYIRLHKGGGLVDFTRTQVMLDSKGNFSVRVVSHENGTSERIGTLGKEERKAMWDSFDWDAIVKLEEQYGGPAEDTQVKTLTLTEKGELIKTVYYTHGEPAILRELEKELDKLLVHE
jgi:hypothetical protein